MCTPLSFFLLLIVGSLVPLACMMSGKAWPLVGAANRIGASLSLSLLSLRVNYYTSRQGAVTSTLRPNTVS